MSNQKLINGINVSGLQETIGKIKADPSLAQCQFRLHNHWINADENRSEVHDFYAAGEEQQHKKKFNFQAGEPPLLEGKDEGANPVEFLLSALSGCMTTTLAYYAGINGYEIKKMESDYEGDLDLHGLFNLDPNVRPGYKTIRIHFKIQTDAPVEELESYYKFSPVYDVVSKSVPVEVKIETY